MGNEWIYLDGTIGFEMGSLPIKARIDSLSSSPMSFSGPFGKKETVECLRLLDIIQLHSGIIRDILDILAFLV